MKVFKLLVLIAGFCLVLNSNVKANAPGFYLKDKVKSTKIPFKLLHNLIVLSVKINGKKYDMVMDTGVRSFVLFGTGHRKLINTDIEIKVGGWGEQAPQTGKVSANNKIRIGQVEGNGISLLILKDNYLTPLLRNRIDGILGYEIFSRFKVKIDYENREMTISSQDRDWAAEGYQQIPIKIVDTKPYINGKVTTSKGQIMHLSLMVDTGAAKDVLLNQKAVDGLYEAYYTSEIGYGLSGEINGFKLRNVLLEIGDYEMGSVKCEVASNMSSPDPKVMSHGVIGSKALKRFDVIFDYENELMYLKPKLEHNEISPLVTANN